MERNAKLWGSRMGKQLDPQMQRLNASLPFDLRLVEEDLDGSLAWARGLQAAGILNSQELTQMIAGLHAVRKIFHSGQYNPDAGDEDIHSAVERLLSESIGPLAGKLHTGRSRNDQVATDFRLWIMRACAALDKSILELAGALLRSAQAGISIPMPGYTHLQPAQPVTWGHWLLSHFWPLARDRRRLAAARRAASVLPLGSAALAGTPFPIDRQALAAELGFAEISPNSIDAVADRDFALDFLYAAATLGIHLSRLAEALIIFSSAEFGFVELDDAYATGSSLMPQKKNPDALELARGKSGRLIANLTGLLVTLKGLPSAYDKDLQEDKEPVFDAFDTLSLLLPVLAGVIDSLQLHPQKMSQRLVPALLATELADYLVARGVPFRQAHNSVGAVVRRALSLEIPLNQLPLSELQAIDAVFEEDVAACFDVQVALEKRSAPGGTSSQALAEQLKAAHKSLAE